MFHVEHSRRAWATGGLPYLGDPRRVAERRELRRLGFARKPGVEKADSFHVEQFPGAGQQGRSCCDLPAGSRKIGIRQVCGIC